MAIFAFLSPACALLLGFALAAWLYRARLADAAGRARSEMRAEASELESTAAAMRATAAQLHVQLGAVTQERDRAQQEFAAAAQRAAAAEARLIAEMDNAERQRREHLSGNKTMEDRFKVIAADALETNSRRFLPALEAELNRQHEKTAAVFDKGHTAVDELLKPLRETLGKLDQQTREMEGKHNENFGSVRELIETMQQSHRDLRTETTQLVSALRKPEVRGHWGEVQLHRCLEFAGMLEHVDFCQQTTLRSSDGDTLRPDVIIHMPNKRAIAVDSKVPLDAFLQASATADPVLRQQLLQQHASQVRKHVQQLESKAYGRALEKSGSPGLVVCFLPSEVLLSAALDADPSLIACSRTVVLATPTTLIGLLKAVECGWQQMEIARSAQQIFDLAREMYAKTANAHANLSTLGVSLRRAVESYNDFLTKVEGKGGIFSLGRKLREMKIGDKDMGDSPLLDHGPRVLHHPDWDMSLLEAGEQTQPN